jgi:hypothetical protein
MQTLHVLSSMLTSESSLLDLESQLSAQLSTLRELEQNIITQNSELQSLIELTECTDLSLIYPEECFQQLPKEKEEDLYVRLK